MGFVSQKRSGEIYRLLLWKWISSFERWLFSSERIAWRSRASSRVTELPSSRRSVVVTSVSLENSTRNFPLPLPRPAKSVAWDDLRSWRWNELRRAATLTTFESGTVRENRRAGWVGDEDPNKASRSKAKRFTATQGITTFIGSLYVGKEIQYVR